MKRRLITYIVLLTSIFAFGVQAQMKERGLTRKGNEFVKDSLFVMAEAEYLKSLDIHDFDTNRFNLAFARLGQEKFDEAIEEWKSVESTSEDKVLKSYCLYNIGGALVMQKKYNEAIEEYKQALRYFPKNDVARHNYWLLKLMKNQKQGNQGDKGEESQDQQDEKSEDSEGDESSDKSDEGKDENQNEPSDKSDEGKDENQNESSDKSDEEKSDEEDDSSGGDEEKQDEDQQSNEELKAGELSTGDALRLLESLDKEEDKTQEKVKAKLLKGKKRKKHDKDW